MDFHFDKFAKIVDAQLEGAQKSQQRYNERAKECNLYNLNSESVSLIFKHIIYNDSLEEVDLDSFSIEDCYRAAALHQVCSWYVDDDDDFGDECYIFGEDHPLSYHHAHFHYKKSMDVARTIKLATRKFV